MSKVEQFMSALQHPETSVGDDLLRRQLRAWIDDLTKLCADIREWMIPVVEQNLALVHEHFFLIEYPEIDGYDAPGLRIKLALPRRTRVVEVRPRGREVVGIAQSNGTRFGGAAGRVDLECGAKREILLRFESTAGTTWQFFSSGTPRVLDSDSFFKVLARVAEVDLQ